MVENVLGGIFLKWNLMWHHEPTSPQADGISVAVFMFDFGGGI